MTDKKIDDQEKLGDWVREQFQKANKYLAENGVLFQSVVMEDSRYLAPYLAVWKIQANDGKYYWVISGDLPTDFALQKHANDAREAIRHFSLNWQMKAENIRQSGTKENTQLAFADLLQTRAEDLYAMFSDEKLWQSA